MSRKLARLGLPIAKHRLLKLYNLWPPFVTAGISCVHATADLREIDMQLVERPWNRNYVGTHFGGSLYSMADAPYMIMVMENLGDGYIVWDKAATIRFKKPGLGTVTARFRVTQEQIDEIRAAAEAGAPIDRTLTVSIKDRQGVVVAEVDKVLYVRKKERP